ncbi:MAG TPA: TRAM domain-containing protein [Spirochaetota bacterium]|nr:TRAM domain-containing protein [Spirochaetota bacterium]HPC39954.1 TRAM domain-containing protein [Spirochaetota bacterium]HPL16229.1 TRAM domain-containing protein [Spirochaetota bacterium]HQF10302.1 TRAM domain-containing protein [Spirochaetota bacterium]HQJ71572.1 TRAM domain-containing protein [Spirochaetota bacterium]
MIIILRILFIVLSMLFSSLYFVDKPFYIILAVAAVAGVVSLLVLILVEYVLHTFSARTFAAAIIGLIIGFTLGHLLNLAYGALHITALDEYSHIITPLIYHLTGFFVMMFFVINYEEISFLDKIVSSSEESSDEKIAYKILDTSVIIDGRIADICDTGFIEGILVIPNFVLNELQMIADSADSIKRNRGRRGLDILNKMQKDQSIMVKITDMDFADINEVDAKLVKLAKIMNAKVVTNDFNLNKVAEFHGVPVLNINQLSNALKPVVLPGEEMRVALIKEGKDQNQAIGYLDDGTMVVVENGRRRLNDEVDVTVTSVLQTTAGRMIFTRLKD